MYTAYAYLTYWLVLIGSWILIGMCFVKLVETLNFRVYLISIVLLFFVLLGCSYLGDYADYLSDTNAYPTPIAGFFLVSLGLLPIFIFSLIADWRESQENYEAPGNQNIFEKESEK